MLQLASPPVSDVAVKGVHCLDMVAVVPHEAWTDDVVPIVAFLDCRPMLQGLSLILAEGGQVRYSSLMSDLDTWTPEGWQVQLDPIAVDDDVFLVTPGCTIVASYVPLSSEEEGSDAAPWEGYDSRPPSDDVGPASANAIGRGNQRDRGSSGASSSSRSRSPLRDAPEPGAGPSASLCMGNARTIVAVCAMLGLIGLLLWLFFAAGMLGCHPGADSVGQQIFGLSRMGIGFFLTMRLKAPFPVIALGWMLASCEVALAVQTRPLPCVHADVALMIDATGCRANGALPLSGLGIPSQTADPVRARAIPAPCRSSLAASGLPEICNLRTLLEESVAQPSSQAFFLASTLLEVLEEHFYPEDGGQKERYSTPPVLELDSLLPLQSSPNHSVPETYDLTRQSCMLPGNPEAVNGIFTRALFSMLPPAPVGLHQPDRFLAWISAGCVGRSPAPNETLVITSDGSHCASSGAAGWGITFSLCSNSTDEGPGQFVGCLCGSLAVFSPLSGAERRS